MVGARLASHSRRRALSPLDAGSPATDKPALPMNPYRRLAKDLSVAEHISDFMKVQEQAKRLMGDDAAKKARVRVKKAPKLAKKASERRGYISRTALIRQVVFDRCGDRCESCGFPASDLHHLLSGGLRRARQDVSNVVALCSNCHREAHRNDPDLFRAVLAHNELHGHLSREAVDAINYRLSKVTK